GISFQRHARVPILDRTDQELFVRTGCYVLYDNGIWRMWYLGGSRWIDIKGKATPTYNLRYLQSSNGLDWGKTGVLSMDLGSLDEFGFGRPYVRKQATHYQMWYSIRTISKGYRPGFAESTDGLSWVRKDHEVGLDVSPDGWDSEMICYSTLLKVHGATY